MKFTLCYMATQGQDVLVDMDSFKLGSRFANKVWNAARFILMNLEGAELVDLETAEKNTLDRWIYHQLNKTAKRVEVAMDSYKFNEGAQAIYDFFWNDFCDWYVESAKRNLYSEDAGERSRQVSLLLDLLSQSMRLMHPFASFISDEIYSRLPNTHDELITSAYPVYSEALEAGDDALLVARLQEAVSGIRALKAELSIPAERKVGVLIKTDADFAATHFFIEQQALIASFVGASNLEIAAHADTAGAIPVAGSGYESFVFVGEAIDVKAEIDKIASDLVKNEKLLAQVNAKLANEQFLANAKREAIEKEEGKRLEFEEKIEKGRKHRSLLERFI